MSHFVSSRPNHISPPNFHILNDIHPLITHQHFTHFVFTPLSSSTEFAWTVLAISIVNSAIINLPVSIIIGR